MCDSDTRGPRFNPNSREALLGCLGNKIIDLNKDNFWGTGNTEYQDFDSGEQRKIYAAFFQGNRYPAP